MTDKLFRQIETLGVDKNMSACFFNIPVYLKKVDKANVKMVVPYGGDGVYGPGAGVETRFVPAPVLPIEDFQAPDCQTVEENEKKEWRQLW